jgi:hypothetical protein
VWRSHEAAVSGEGDGAKLDVEPLVVDNLVGGLVLGLGVDVGDGTTCSLTRRLIDVGVDVFSRNKCRFTDPAQCGGRTDPKSPYPRLTGLRV